MNRTLLALCAAAVLAPHPVSAQLGRLVSTPDLLQLTASTCVASGADFQITVPLAAAKGRWDEYGKKAGTPSTTRAWLVSLKGLPVVVDISETGRVGMCSVNAVSDPAAVTNAITANRGKPQISTRSNGDKVARWAAKGKLPTMSVESSPGRAMTRISVLAPAG